jgi:uncharacterized protein YggE
MPRSAAAARALPSTRAGSSRILLMSGAVLAAAALMAAPAARAQSQPDGGAPMVVHAVADRPALNLSAYGETKVKPDMARINFGVVTEAPTAADAMSQNAQKMTQVMAAIGRAGIRERDVQTSGLNLQPIYDYVQNEPPRLRGYQVTNRVTVEIHELDRAGATADAVVSAGVNQIDGISFGLRDPAEAENAARQAAVRNLRGKADLYAAALGVRLGGIRSLSEGGGYSSPPPMPMYAARNMSMDSAQTQIAPGELTVRIDITGVYDLVR